MSPNYQRRYNYAIRRWLRDVFEFASRIKKSDLRRRPCPVCGSRKYSWFANNDYLDYDRCGRCSLVFMNPALMAEKLNAGFQGEDKIVMAYFRILRRYRKTLAVRPDPRKDGKLRDIYRFKKRGRLLDVGCGLGDFLEKAKHFYRVEGVEINPYTAAIAQKKFIVHKGFLADLKLPASYDVVTLNQILYGVPDPVGLLQDINKVLKRNGVLYINTPNADSFAMKLYQGKCNHLYGYTTQNVFNRDSLQWIAKATGYRIVSFRTEWLDIYTADLMQFLSHPSSFIHKRNPQVSGYEEKMKAEDELYARHFPDLENHGNYLVAVLAKQ